jgi:hypothetical protein
LGIGGGRLAAGKVSVKKRTGQKPLENKLTLLLS